MIKNVTIERTKKGLPAMWESGGGYTNTGEAVIIANTDGLPKKPLYIRRRGSLACDNHVLFVVQPGDLVVEANHHRRDFEIKVWRISQILEEEAQLSLAHEYSQGEWDVEPPEYLRAAIEAVQEKAICYHCREPHYYIQEEAE